MPYQLDTHVLTVDANVIHKVDTTNPANLYSMWTVFSRCADSVEQGRRLENLSWRLWQREQLAETDRKEVAPLSTVIPSSPPTLKAFIPETRLQEVPGLSGSIDSLADEETGDFTSESAPLEILRPRIHRLDSTVSSRSRRDRHISSDDFEKMVVSIVKDKAPLSAPNPTSPLANRTKTTPATFTHTGSTTTETHSLTRESDISNVSQSIPSPQLSTDSVFTEQAPVADAFPQPTQAVIDSIPAPTSSPASKPVHSKKAAAQFALGGSCSSSELSPGTEAEKLTSPLLSKKPMFQIGGSSEEESSLKSSTILEQPHSARESRQNLKSNTPRIEPESAVESDTEGESVDESAIDDEDDSSDWEDSIEDSGKSSVDEKFFQRVESKGKLASRPSLITLMLAQNERARTLGSTTSQSTSAIPPSRTTPNGIPLGGSPNDSDEGPLMMKGIRHSMLKPIVEIPRSSAQPIAAPTTHVHAQAALSPRTTRRHMLATELTESLRRHLLWERQQKTSTANAVLKRRHTSHDVANLQQFPDKPCMKESEDVNASSWNQYFSREALNGYHSKGW